jgi:hypothetical protein
MRGFVAASTRRRDEDVAQSSVEADEVQFTDDIGQDGRIEALEDLSDRRHETLAKSSLPYVKLWCSRESG